MTPNFPHCLAFTLRYEGGRADDPRDPGGRTNQGITQRSFVAWLATQGEPSRDVFTMTDAERDAIYETRFWRAVGGDSLAPGVDLALFDFGVNSGPARALKAYAARTSNDGATIVRAVCGSRLSFLHALGTFRIFGRGWTARVVACEALGVKMAEHARIGLPVDAPTAPQVASTMQTQSQAAHRKARGAAKAGGAIAATGLAVHPAAMATTHLPWGLLAASALGLSGVVGWALWKAREGRLRGLAYAATASA